MPYRACTGLRVKFSGHAYFLIRRASVSIHAHIIPFWHVWLAQSREMHQNNQISIIIIVVINKTRNAVTVYSTGQWHTC